MFACQANFAFKLLQKINDDNKSIVISPISISTSLAMILLGAKNNTAKQFQDVIADKGSDCNEVHKHFATILSNISDDIELNTVNIVYIDSILALLDSFKQKMDKYYHGKLQSINFSENVKTAEEINNYVSKYTDHKIRNLVEPQMFNDATKMVIINAMNFNKKWLYSFNAPSDKFPFYFAPDEKEIKIQMLTSKSDYRHLLLEDCQATEFPYNDKNFSMIIILPRERFGLSTLLKNIKIDQIITDILNAPEETVTVSIPKFKTESSFELPKTLKQLGIVDAFDPARADFSGISERQLHVSTVIHKAVIEVSETGTKASTSTYVDWEYGSATLEKIEYYFIADHPFLYLIIDQSKNIYFMGIFNKP